MNPTFQDGGKGEGGGQHERQDMRGGRVEGGGRRIHAIGGFMMRRPFRIFFTCGFLNFVLALLQWI